MTKLLFALTTLLPIAASAEPVKIDLGRYDGTDQSGRPCTLRIVGDFGGNGTMTTAVLDIDGMSFRIFVPNPQTSTPGVFKSERIELMYDGYYNNLHNWRTFSGAPVGTQVINGDLRIDYRRARPTSAGITPYELGGNPSSSDTRRCTIARAAI